MWARIGSTSRGIGGWGLLAVATLGCSSSSVSSEEPVGSQSSALCSSVTSSISPASPPPLNATLHFSASATCGTGGREYAFLWQTAGTPLTSGYIQNWSSSSTADWNTTGFNGAYNLYAYARQVGNTGPDSTAFVGSYLLGKVCSAVSLSVSPPPAPNTSPPLGTPITLSASATCLNSGSPEYQFFSIPPGTATYVQVPQADSVNGWGGPTATLNTSTIGSGLYSLYVRTRARGNVSSLEGSAYGPASYYIGNVCPQMLSFTAGPSSPQLRGTNITLTANSSCLRTAPDYKFSYKLSTASTFTDIGSGWGPANVAMWNTGNLAPGAYVLQAFSRGQGNASTTEGYSQIPFTLDPSFVIAVNGQPAQPIYYGKAERSQDGATDLATKFNQMSGATFATQAISGTTPPQAPGIFVVSADDDAALVPPVISGLPATPMAKFPTGAGPTYREAFVIQQVGAQLWLVGKTRLGVRHAVSRLLHDLGHRYFFPGRHWEVIPTSPTLAYTGLTVVDQPRTVTRAIAGDGFNDPTQLKDRLEWRKRNGLAYDYTAKDSSGNTQYYSSNTSLPLAMIQGAFGSQFDGNSTNPQPPPDPTYNFIARTNVGQVPGCVAAGGWFNDPQHPDRYGSGIALDPSWGHTTIEVTNLEVRNCFWTWVTQVDPNRHTYPDILIEPSDGTDRLSALPAASALGNDADQLVYLAANLLTRANPADDPANPTTRHYASMLSGYGHKTPPLHPASPALYVGVMPRNDVASGTYTTSANPQDPTPTASLMAAWAARGASVGLWANYSAGDRGILGLGYDHTLLFQSPDYVNDSVALGKEFRDQGAAGSVVDIFESQDNFGRYGIGYYLTAQLSWSSTLDVPTLRNDFFRSAFPRAYVPMQQYFDLFDPKGQPLLITKDTLAAAYAFLQQAGNLAAGSQREVERIDDLKAFMHHNSLWWQIQRAPHCGPGAGCTIDSPQPKLVRALLNWDYRNRYSYMTSYYTDSYLGNAASIQFALPEFSTPATWQACTAQQKCADLVTTDIDQAFADDLVLFSGTSPVQQLTWSADPVAVSDFTGSATVSAFTLSNVKQSLAVAAFTTNGALSLQVKPAAPQPGTFASGFPADQIPSTRVWLTDTAGNQLSDTSGQPLTRTLPALTPTVTATYQTVSFPSIRRPAGVPASGNFGVIAHVDASGYWSDVFEDATHPAAWMLDKVYRITTISSPSSGSPQGGLFFYVPKSATKIIFSYDRFPMTGGTDAVSAPFAPPLFYDDTNVTPYTVTTGPQDISSIDVPLAHRGKLWRVSMGPTTHTSQLWFYNIPPYLAAFPSHVLVPRDLAAADGLHRLP